MMAKQAVKQNDRIPYSARIRKDIVKSIKMLAVQEETEIYTLFEEALQMLLAERNQKAKQQYHRS